MGGEGGRDGEPGMTSELMRKDGYKSKAKVKALL